jgi:hypothetical protein
LKAPKGGGAIVSLTPNAPSLPTAGIAVNGTDVYWASMVPAGIRTVPVGGGAPSLLAPDTVASMPGPIAVDSTSVYWADMVSGSVLKAPLGGGMATTIATGQDSTEGIAVDETSVYLLNNGNGKPGSVMRLTPK